jgi:predicted nucleic acid-binding protein
VSAVLVDAGALIALLDRSDQHHESAARSIAILTDSLLTVMPAVTEAMHLLARVPRGQDALFDLIEDEAVSLADLGESDFGRMKVLMRKYRSLPMDFADAALVRVAERERITRILTFDRDFQVYSLPGRARFKILEDLT